MAPILPATESRRQRRDVTRFLAKAGEEVRGREVEVSASLRSGTYPHPRGNHAVYPWDCKEKALEYVRLHPDAVYVTGTYYDGRPHGWAEIGNVAFDPNLQRFYERESYYAAIEAKPERRLTHGELRQAAADGSLVRVLMDGM